MLYVNRQSYSDNPDTETAVLSETNSGMDEFWLEAYSVSMYILYAFPHTVSMFKAT